MKRIITLLILLGLFSISASAEQALTAAEIRALISNKTIDAVHLRKDFTFKVYFDAKGNGIQYVNEIPNPGHYKFEGNMHCIDFPGTFKCSKVVKNDDGTYTRILNGTKPVIKWIKFTEGKIF